MKFDQYAPLALRTAKPFQPESAGDLRHAALGLITEVGEFATLVKRWTIYDRPLSDTDRGHALEELGDVQWYVSLALRGLGVTPQSGLEEALAVARSRHSLNNQTLESVTLLLGALAGEFSAVVITLLSGEKPNQAPGRTMIKIIFACELAAQLLGADPDAVREANIVKLRARFPTAYSDSAAEARADKGGLDARQS